MTIDLADRDLRQRQIVPPEALAACPVTVVGVGAVGRQVALQLAALGAPRIELIDFDTVEPVNLAAQGYLEEDLGRLKVDATADLCRRIHSGIDVTPIAGRFRRSMDVAGAVFCCVDAIDTRRLIWQAVRDRAAFFADGRMNAEVLRVLVAADEPSRAHYPTTLFTAAEAYAGSCTARSTIYTANLCAALMVGQFTKWLRRLPVDPDLMLNLLAGEWSVIPAGAD